VKKVSKLKIFFVENQVPQKELAQQSGVGVTSLHYMINEKRATNKTLNRVVTCLKETYGITTTFEALKEMMLTDQG